MHFNVRIDVNINGRLKGKRLTKYRKLLKKQGFTKLYTHFYRLYGEVDNPNLGGLSKFAGELLKEKDTLEVNLHFEPRE